MQSKNFTDLIEEFIEDVRLEGRAPGTISEYRQRLEVFSEYLKKKNLKIEDATNVDIQAFIRHLRKKGQKNSTIRGKLSALHVFNKWLVKNDLLPQMIITLDDYPKNVNQERIRRLTDEELEIFSGYIDTLQDNARAAFYLMLGSGCRVGEAAHLRPEDVTRRGKAVYIDIRDAKWGSDRCIPIVDAKAAKVVWDYRQNAEIDNQPLFRLSKRTLQGYATKFAKSTGITFRCHLLRHTFAGRLAEKSVPLTTIQYLLGHKSLGMTAHYASSALVDVSDITPNVFL